MRTIAVIQARFGSSRLRGKALMTLGGRPMLAHVIERARAIPGLDGVILATTVSEADDPVANVAIDSEIPFWRGSEADVLGRFLQAAEQARAEVVMRLTGDCPLLCPDVAQQVLDTYLTGPVGGYAWSDTATSGWPDGQDAEVFSIDLLRRTELRTRTWSQNLREHVTMAMRGDQHWLRSGGARGTRFATCVSVPPAPLKLSHLKLSVDTQTDYERAVGLYRHIGGDLSWPALVRACLLAGLIRPDEMGAVST